MIQSITAMEVSQVGQTSCALHPDPHPQILAWPSLPTPVYGVLRPLASSSTCWTLSSHHHRIPEFAHGTSIQLLSPIPGAQKVPASLIFLQTAPLPKPSCWGQAESGWERK